jgi:DNA repair exonuclease SbcCD ATPase subunit
MSEDIKSCAKCGKNLTEVPERIRNVSSESYFCPGLECVPEKDWKRVFDATVKEWARLRAENWTLTASIQEKDEIIAGKDEEIAELLAQQEREFAALEQELQEAKDDAKWRRTKALKEKLGAVNLKLESSEEKLAELQARHRKLQRDVRKIFSQQIQASASANTEAGCASKGKEPMP